MSFRLSRSLLSLAFFGLAAPLHAGSASLLLDIGQGGSSAEEAQVQGSFFSLGPSVLVPIHEPDSGRELWATDGTDVGTRPLLDVCPGACSSFFSLLGVVRQVGILRISTELDSTGRLWRSDGTRPGTFPLAPASGGALEECRRSSGAAVSSLLAGRAAGEASAAAADFLLLLASQAGGESCGLWRTDGTPAGTFPLAPVPGGPLEYCNGTASLSGTVHLLAARAPGESCSLWRTDGTVAGTVKVQEINPGPFRALVDGRAFFVASQRSGWELWRSDGTPEGTVRLRSWTAGPPADFFTSGSRIFFTALEDGRELWTSDGTVAGTRPLTRLDPVNPFVYRGGTVFVQQDVGGSVCFLANDGSTGIEMWCSDGTPAGTRPATSLPTASPFVNLETWRVERLAGRLLFPANDGARGNRWWTSDGRPGSTAPLAGCPGGCPVLDVESPLVRVGSRIFFAALGEGPSDPEEPPTTDLWVTDGTGAGTRRVGDFCDSCRVDRMVSVLGKLFFSAGDGSFDYDLWASDGTPEGTRLLVPVGGFDHEVLPFPPAVLGGLALLAQKDSGLGGPGLWLSDGTPAGTRELAFLARNGLGSDPAELVPTPGGVRFLASSEAGRLLWESRGTPETTAPVDTEHGIEELTAFGPLTLIRFFGEDSLWRTDGTAAGTFPLTPDGLTSGIPVAIGGRALFVAQEPDGTAASLWATDGTVAGTREIAALPSRFVGIHPAGSLALIAISSDVLWRTDGTAAGTREIPLPDDFQSYNSGDVAQLGSALFFRGYSFNGQKLWRSDGTPGGTRPFADSLVGAPGSFAAHAGALYILAHTADPATNQIGIFRSDGTEAGTVLLASVRSTTTAVPERAELTGVGPLVFFVFDDGQRGRELWRTDGTPAGTFLVRDLVPGRGSSQPRNLTALGGRLYFTASSPGHGTELWESDGTEAGTRLVHDIEPGALSSAPDDLVAGGGRLFFTADDRVHGREPWVYAPGGGGCQTAETALCLGERFRVEADWHVSADASGRGRAVALTADTGYFWFFDPANVEVIFKVLDGQGLNGHHWVFFGALSDVEYSLTVTDTQTGATRRYANPPGRLGSVADTRAFGPLGASVPAVLSEGPEPAAGQALIATRSTAAGSCTPSATRLCLNNGRFAVEARWTNQGQTGTGQTVPLGGGDTGYFWFFDANNVEVVLKVLDGRPLNGRFWVFYGALSDVEYTLTVTDTETGAVKTYTNPKGRLASVADTGAF